MSGAANLQMDYPLLPQSMKSLMEIQMYVSDAKYVWVVPKFSKNKTNDTSFHLPNIQHYEEMFQTQRSDLSGKLLLAAVLDNETAIQYRSHPPSLPKKNLHSHHPQAVFI